ncbi:MAG: hypothetical protein HKN03_09870 [Acidimicrobiales bacterium]|nr:hypothetical protein [Acidimicrobiales bacterium]
MPTKRAPVLESVPSDSESIGDVEPDSAGPLQPEPEADKELVPPGPSAPILRNTSLGPLSRLARLLAAFAVVGGIGVGAYVGWPIVRERYIQPVETTASDVSALQERLTASLSRIEELENRLAAEENATVALGDAIADLQGSSESLAAQDVQTGRTVQGLTTSLVSLSDQLAAVEASLTQTDRFAVEQSVTMVAAQYLGRARLFLYQANYGLAEQDIAAAVESLTQLPADGQNSEVIGRLNAAAEALPDRPVLAAGELDIAWGALLSETEPG